MWTLSELKSSIRPYSAHVWRIVEAQHKSSTMKLVDTLSDQSLLEDMLENTKPPIPEGLEGYHYLLSAPFRYAPTVAGGSRFRRAGQADGAFYAAETTATAAAEISFYRQLFFSHAEGVAYPETGGEYTAFSVKVQTDFALDLRVPPFSETADLLDKTDYSCTQNLADMARDAGVNVIISQSVRCPEAGTNVTILHPEAFAEKKTAKEQTWKFFPREDRVIAWCEFPSETYEFLTEDFQDPRLKKK